MAAKNGSKKMLWVLLGVFAVAAAVIFVWESLDSSKENIFRENDTISRDALYQASATILAISIFSSILAFKFGGKRDSRDIRIDAASLIFAGTVFVAILQVILMRYACCAPEVNTSTIDFFVFMTFIAMLMLGIGAALLIKASLEKDSQGRAKTP